MALSPSIARSTDFLLDDIAPVVRLLSSPFEVAHANMQNLLPSFLTAKPFNPTTDIPDLSGKVILVTGGTFFPSLIQSNPPLIRATGNTGLGKQTILNLAAHRPAHIYLAARTPAKAEAALADVRAAVPDAPPLTFLPLDLADLGSVAACAARFRALSPRLDVLLLNAGIMAVPAGATADGLELQLGTNHLGHFLLMRRLLPVLRTTARMDGGAGARVVVMTSEAHRMAPFRGLELDATRLAALAPWPAYANAKLANLLCARELARREPALTAVAVHPGLVATDLFAASRASSWLLRTAMGYLPGVWATVETGAWNQTWAATCPREALKSGAYYTPVGKEAGGSWPSQDKEQARRLWEWSEEELSKRGYGETEQ